jgi:hypothetical protein
VPSQRFLTDEKLHLNQQKAKGENVDKTIDALLTRVHARGVRHTNAFAT